MTLDAAERQVIETLNRRGVKYVVIGGHAVQLHGYRRPANDLDIVVEPSIENAPRVLAALADLRLSGPRLTTDELSQPRKLVPLGNYGGQILTSAPGIDFDDLYGSRVMASVDGLDVAVVSREHLVRMKGSSGRKKDRRDYRRLLKSGAVQR